MVKVGESGTWGSEQGPELKDGRLPKEMKLSTMLENKGERASRVE